MTTELQKLMLDALDMLGSMSVQELETACLINKKRRGGFHTSLQGLFKRRLVAADAYQVRLLPAGVFEIEALNAAAERRSCHGSET